MGAGGSGDGQTVLGCAAGAPMVLEERSRGVEECRSNAAHDGSFWSVSEKKVAAAELKTQTTVLN